MNCAAVQERLVAFQDGELSRGEHTRVREHLDTCGGCRRLERALAAVTPEPAEPLPAAATAPMFSRMDAALDAAWSRPSPATPAIRTSVSTQTAALLAYAALLLLSVAWGTYNWRQARSLEVALAASRPVAGGVVVPARAEPTELPAGQFVPAAWVPDAAPGPASPSHAGPPH